MSQRPQNILILTSWSYREPLTHSYVLPNLRIIQSKLPVGSTMFLQTLEKVGFEVSKEERKQIHEELSTLGLSWVPIQYPGSRFSAVFLYPLYLFKLFLLSKKNQITTLHAFAPLASFFALLLHKVHHSKLICDSWEPHAEAMVETGVWSRKSILFRILWWSERRVAQEADALIAASPGMVNYAVAKWGTRPSLVVHRPACVNLQVFKPNAHWREKWRAEWQWKNKVVCVCAAKLGGMYLLEEAIIFFKSCYDAFGHNFAVILLSESSPQMINDLCDLYQLSRECIKILHVSHEQMPMYLSAADFAFNPQKPVPSKKYGTPVKDGEYWAMGLPVVLLPDISDDSDIVLKHNVGVVLNGLAVTDIHDAVQKLKELLAEPEETSKRCREVARQYRGYHLAEMAYEQVYTQL